MISYYDFHLKQFHEKRNTKAFYKAQSFEKLWNSFQDFIKTKAFQNLINHSTI